MLFKNSFTVYLIYYAFFYVSLFLAYFFNKLIILAPHFAYASNLFRLRLLKPSTSGSLELERLKRARPFKTLFLYLFYLKNVVKSGHLVLFLPYRIFVSL